jgi:hypothetical protein
MEKIQAHGGQPDAMKVMAIAQAPKTHKINLKHVVHVG